MEPNIADFLNDAFSDTSLPPYQEEDLGFDPLNFGEDDKEDASRVKKLPVLVDDENNIAPEQDGKDVNASNSGSQGELDWSAPQLLPGRSRTGTGDIGGHEVEVLHDTCSKERYSVEDKETDGAMADDFSSMGYWSQVGDLGERFEYNRETGIDILGNEGQNEEKNCAEVNAKNEDMETFEHKKKQEERAITEAKQVEETEADEGEEESLVDSDTETTGLNEGVFSSEMQILEDLCLEGTHEHWFGGDLKEFSEGDQGIMGESYTEYPSECFKREGEFSDRLGVGENAHQRGEGSEWEILGRCTGVHTELTEREGSLEEILEENEDTVLEGIKKEIEREKVKEDTCLEKEDAKNRYVEENGDSEEELTRGKAGDIEEEKKVEDRDRDEQEEMEISDSSSMGSENNEVELEESKLQNDVIESETDSSNGECTEDKNDSWGDQRGEEFSIRQDIRCYGFQYESETEGKGHGHDQETHEKEAQCVKHEDKKICDDPEQGNVESSFHCMEDLRKKAIETSESLASCPEKNSGDGENSLNLLSPFDKTSKHLTTHPHDGQLSSASNIPESPDTFASERPDDFKNTEDLSAGNLGVTLEDLGQNEEKDIAEVNVKNDDKGAFENLQIPSSTHKEEQERATSEVKQVEETETDEGEEESLVDSDTETPGFAKGVFSSEMQLLEDLCLEGTHENWFGGGMKEFSEGDQGAIGESQTEYPSESFQSEGECSERLAVGENAHSGGEGSEWEILGRCTEVHTELTVREGSLEKILEENEDTVLEAIEKESEREKVKEDTCCEDAKNRYVEENGDSEEELTRGEAGDIEEEKKIEDRDRDEQEEMDISDSSSMGSENNEVELEESKLQNDVIESETDSSNGEFTEDQIDSWGNPRGEEFSIRQDIRCYGFQYESETGGKGHDHDQETHEKEAQCVKHEDKRMCEDPEQGNVESSFHCMEDLRKKAIETSGSLTSCPEKNSGDGENSLNLLSPFDKTSKHLTTHPHDGQLSSVLNIPERPGTFASERPDDYKNKEDLSAGNLEVTLEETLTAKETSIGQMEIENSPVYPIMNDPDTFTQTCPNEAITWGSDVATENADLEMDLEMEMEEKSALLGISASAAYDIEGIQDLESQKNTDEDEEEEERRKLEKERIEAFFRYYEDKQDGESVQKALEASARKPTVRFHLEPSQPPVGLREANSSDSDLPSSSSEETEDWDTTTFRGSEELEVDSEEERPKKKFSLLLQQSQATQRELLKLRAELRTHHLRNKFPSMLKTTLKVCLVTVGGVLVFWWATDQLNWIG